MHYVIRLPLAPLKTKRSPGYRLRPNPCYPQLTRSCLCAPADCQPHPRHGRNADRRGGSAATTAIARADGTEAGDPHTVVVGGSISIVGTAGTVGRYLKDIRDAGAPTRPRAQPRCRRTGCDRTGRSPAPARHRNRYSRRCAATAPIVTNLEGKPVASYRTAATAGIVKGQRSEGLFRARRVHNG